MLLTHIEPNFLLLFVVKDILPRDANASKILIIILSSITDLTFWISKISRIMFPYPSPLSTILPFVEIIMQFLV